MGPGRVPVSWDKREINVAKIWPLPELPAHSALFSLPGEVSSLELAKGTPCLAERLSPAPTLFKGRTDRDT